MSRSRRLLGVAIALAVLALIGLTLDRQMLVDVLSRAAPAPLAVAALIYLPSWGLRGLRWKQIAGDLGDEIPLWPATAAATVGNMLNLALPAKAGDLLWAHAAHVRWGIPYGRGIVGVLAGRVLDLVVLSLVGGLALLWVPGAAAWRPQVAAATLGGIAALLVGGQLVLRRRLGARLLLGPLRRLRGLHDALVDPADRLTRSWSRAGWHCGNTALIWANEAAVAWLVARALGLEIGAAAVLFGIMVANLSKIVPLTPASFGTYEAAGAAALTLAGVDYSAAFAVMLAEHLLKNGVNAVIGAAALVVGDVPVLRVDLDAVRGAWAEATRPQEGA